MLVLSRQRDETIMIGDDIEITIVDIRGDKVRLGITAPATIPVHRKEVYEAIQRENREAARVRMEDLPKGTVRPPMTPGLHRHSQRPGPQAQPPAGGNQHPAPQTGLPPERTGAAPPAPPVPPAPPAPGSASQSPPPGPVPPGK